MATNSPLLYFCHPCSKQRKYQIATYFCANCGRGGAYICWQCKQHHEKFDEIRGHRIQAIDRGKCSINDSQGCACDGLDANFVPSENQSARSSKGAKACIFQQVQRLIDNYEKSQANLATVEAKRLEGINQLRDDKDRIRATIRDIRHNLNIQLNRLEKESERELEIRYRRIEERINREIEQIRLVSYKWEKTMQAMINTENKGGVDPWMKILQKGERLRTKSSELWEFSRQRVEADRLDFVPCVGIVNGTFDLKAFGNFVDGKIHKFNTSLEDEYDVSVETDDTDHYCDITGCCVISDGFVILADHHNANLKKLNSTYKVVAKCNLPEPPCDLCPVSDCEVAVTLPKKKTVQFVSVKDDLKLSSSVYVGYGCISIEYSATLEKIYITSDWPMQISVFKKDGSFIKAIWSTEEEPVGKLETKNVHLPSNSVKTTDQTSLTGTSKNPKNSLFCIPHKSRKPKKDNQQIFSMLEDILVSSLDHRLYICDNEKGLIVLSEEGKLILTIRNFKEMPEFAPNRICKGYGDDFFLFGQSEKTKEFGILYVGTDRKVERIKGDILRLTDIADIEAMCFNRYTSQLIVSTKVDNHIKVFNVL